MRGSGPAVAGSRMRGRFWIREAFIAQRVGPPRAGSGEEAFHRSCVTRYRTEFGRMKLWPEYAQED
ncbi:MAG: hypothetical protein EBT75_08925 [Proteobacteria bacterium]|nr:hypothetical protein [Pseudomonadota bacterium]